jgi:hypothetical protein
MQGRVTAYNSGTGALTVNVTAIGGSGTKSSWNISLEAAPGTNGTSGSSGSSGTSGSNGTDGSSGTSGSNGTMVLQDQVVSSGSSGTSGADGNLFTTTSTTSLALGTGAKSLTVDSGLSYIVGQSVAIIYASDADDKMIGKITGYNSGTGALSVTVTTSGGSGTYSSWNVSLESAPGTSGSSGTSGTQVQWYFRIKWLQVVHQVQTELQVQWFKWY